MGRGVSDAWGKLFQGTTHWSGCPEKKELDVCSMKDYQGKKKGKLVGKTKLQEGHS